MIGDQPGKLREFAGMHSGVRVAKRSTNIRCREAGGGQEGKANGGPQGLAEGRLEAGRGCEARQDNDLRRTASPVPPCLAAKMLARDRSHFATWGATMMRRDNRLSRPSKSATMGVEHHEATVFNARPRVGSLRFGGCCALCLVKSWL
jgi:hypothetical protein